MSDVRSDGGGRRFRRRVGFNFLESSEFIKCAGQLLTSTLQFTSRVSRMRRFNSRPGVPVRLRDRHAPALRSRTTGRPPCPLGPAGP